MLQLIRKDIMVQKNIILVLVPLLIVYLMIGSSLIVNGILFSIAIIMQAFLTDEKRQIHVLLNSLPYTRKEIVTAKYLGACIITLFVLLTLSIGNFIINGSMMSWKEMLFVICFTMLCISIFLPFSYKFKSQYLMFGAIGAFAAYLVILNVFIPNLHDRIRAVVATLLAMQQAQLYLLVGGAILVIYFLSWLLSVRIYDKKVF